MVVLSQQKNPGYQQLSNGQWSFGSLSITSGLFIYDYRKVFSELICKSSKEIRFTKNSFFFCLALQKWYHHVNLA